MSINKELFYAAMHKALKIRKIGKTDRDAMITKHWSSVIKDNAEADRIIEHEESTTRDFIKQSRVVVPTESAEQIAVIKWFRSNYSEDFGIIYAIPNGGHRDIRTAVTLKAEGVLAGISDMKIELTDGRDCAVEMKRIKGGVQSDEQKWYEYFCYRRKVPYLLCSGFEDAKRQILEFLEKNNDK